jgi:hypothetical protein
MVGISTELSLCLRRNMEQHIRKMGTFVPGEIAACNYSTHGWWGCGKEGTRFPFPETELGYLCEQKNVLQKSLLLYHVIIATYISGDMQRPLNKQLYDQPILSNDCLNDSC